MLAVLKIMILVELCHRDVEGWHDLTNVDFHCWPLSANGNNPTPFTSCPGVNIRWIVPPPVEIRAQELFNVTYELMLGPGFYSWAVSNNIFNEAGGTGISDANDAETWCENTACPLPKDATQENCCIHHVNVHSCPLDIAAIVQNGLCGPWIPANGSIFTHSQVHVGPVQQGNWTSVVNGLYLAGDVSMIAHFKLAKMHIAIEQKVKVLPRTVCGDGTCEDSEGETCDNCPADCGACPLKVWHIALISIACLAALGVPVCACGYIQYQKRKLLWDNSWILSYEDLKHDCTRRGVFASFISNKSGSAFDSVAGESTCVDAPVNQMFAVTASYDGQEVVIRRITKLHFILTKQIRREVKAVRELDHPNLSRFIGGCIELPNICIISEYCPKGSINDVLLNDDIDINWSFRFSFAIDIARGLCYLHQHKIVHGRVRSNNCVVDDKWTVKITDYGLATFRREDLDEVQQTEYDEKEGRLRVYKGPEFWGMAEYNPTYQGDVYAFGIILIEIATRNDPYGDEDPNSLPEKWRPPLPNLLDEKDQDSTCPCPHKYLKLTETCCSEGPPDRPTFDIVKKTLRKINPTKLSPVDLMMDMMQNYSKNLEILVAERTKDLIAEKQKTDRLLYNMLPREVADNLRVGKPVDAENYESCSVYFSDIVSFTTLSSSSDPMDVVNLLNKLYTTFDTIIDKYDVYKVETIGDAYMVVSGVPKAIPHHAKEVADMAIDIVEACKEFVIPHRPDEALQIRVGIHSGPVCAGVVGLKMPRYCLFGDTVNTASRMESNSEPYKIHISDSAHRELVKSETHIFKLRGVIPIKGKGDMKTWWVIGRKDAQSTPIYSPSYTIADKHPITKHSHTDVANSPVTNQSYTVVQKDAVTSKSYTVMGKTPRNGVIRNGDVPSNVPRVE